jgi:hypothetical protein
MTVIQMSERELTRLRVLIDLSDRRLTAWREERTVTRNLTLHYDSASRPPGASGSGPRAFSRVALPVPAAYAALLASACDRVWPSLILRSARLRTQSRSSRQISRV